MEQIGIGEVFVIAGQSNASGRGTNNQTTGVYPYPSVTLYGNDYVWKRLQDPTDSPVNQVDAVSDDSNAGGSVWPILGGLIAQYETVPVAFIPCAMGGTGISQWEPSGSHTNKTTLYGSMVWRAGYAIPGGVRAVLWWQGENEAAAGINQPVYFAAYTNLSASIASDLGAVVMPCKLENASEYSEAAQAQINAAIGQAWSNDVNTVQGPDLSVISTQPEDTVHLITTVKLQQAAGLWYSAMTNAFGW